MVVYVSLTRRPLTRALGPGAGGWEETSDESVIAITVLFAPTSLVITTDSPPDLANLVERDTEGRMTRINLPDRLVVMANHQAYTDWMYLWILACYSGNSRGVVILLKAALKNIPIVGWGMVSPSSPCHTTYRPTKFSPLSLLFCLSTTE